MRSALLALIVCTSAAASPAGAPSPLPAKTSAPIARTAEAPADAYFGSFGMSPLSIRSTIGLLGRQYHYRTISDHDLLRKALMTEDALRKWRAQYPADPWLPPTFFHLEQLYQAVQSDEARKHATAILNDVAQHYAGTKEGKLSRVRLAAGFPPLVAESELVSTPAPAGNGDVLSATSSPTPSAAPTGAPSGTPPSAATATPHD